MLFIKWCVGKSKRFVDGKIWRKLSKKWLMGPQYSIMIIIFKINLNPRNKIIMEQR
jgi:hypothetical protein